MKEQNRAEKCRKVQKRTERNRKQKFNKLPEFMEVKTETGKN